MQNPSRLDQATEKDIGEKRNKKNKQVASSQGDKQKKWQGRIEALGVTKSCHLTKEKNRVNSGDKGVHTTLKSSMTTKLNVHHLVTTTVTVSRNKNEEQCGHQSRLTYEGNR